MPISPGEKLGPYEVIAPLGAGGMGEVYKARDTRLNRTVAIKVLPDHIAQREDLRARFEREARAVASLNHPHICTLHDIGPGYMVMELIEGDTLAHRIAKGALPLEQALKFAAEIAGALDRAHRAGVTHRDVKPHNIMLTRDGVKVLDFGLAKSTSKLAPSESTLTASLTTEGTVMGTPQYMAPEQFEGHEADARSDIWAFGAVLYEMVTGEKAFQGKSYSSLVGAILSADPPPMAVKPFTPAWLERLVRRCLAKDPEDRWQTMRDIVIELRTPPQDSVATAPSPLRLGWVAAGALALALITVSVLLYQNTRPAPPRPLMRFHTEVAEGAALARVDSGVGTGTGGHMLAISPDGTRLAITLRGTDGKVRLHTRLLNQTQTVLLAGTENAHSPFFSPAGDWLAFFAEGRLKKVALAGGAPVTLCNAPMGYGGSWGDDDNIIAALSYVSTLSRIPSSGGTPVPVTKLNGQEVTHRWPQVLPGSQWVLFSASDQTGTGGYDDATIEAVSLQSGERKTILQGGFFARLIASAAGSKRTAHLVYLHQGTLFAAPFDSDRMALLGPSVPVLEQVSFNPAAGGDFAFAQDGTFVYLSSPPASTKWPISWADASGKTQPLYAPLGQYVTLRFSPDGKQLAFSASNDRGSDIWVKDLDRDTPLRLSSLPGANAYPVWTPDGKTIVFRSTNPAAPGLYGVRSDGSGEAVRLKEGSATEFPTSVSPDGKRLALHQTGINGSRDIVTIPVEAAPGTPGIRLGKSEVFLGTPFVEAHPAFSPDGHWLAYVSNESGANEVYVRPFPGPGQRWQISADGGSAPVWSRNSHELFFRSNDQHVMVVTFAANSGSFSAGRPRIWTGARLRTSIGSFTYDATPDGKRLAAILADANDDGKPPTHLTFLLHFVDELRRKVPLEK